MADPFYHSAELRWFLPGDDAREALLGWFRGPDGALVKEESPRTDSYLLLPASDAVGVKQRQGRLEVKTRVAGPVPYAAHGAVGRLDQWVKWSFDPAEAIADALARALDRAGPWRAVEKRRFLLKLAADEGAPAPVAASARPTRGCNVELTVLSATPGAARWLTLGFEAFGPPAGVAALLDEAVAHFFGARGAPPVALEGRDSLSYPAWLALAGE